MLVKEADKRRGFGHVTGACACAVCFDELNLVRVNPGVFVSTDKCFLLAFAAWRVDALKASVTATADAAQNGINSIAVAFSIRQALEHDHPDAFTDHHPIGFFIEVARYVVGRKSGCFAEAHIHKGAVVGIHAACNHHIGAAFDQFADRELHRGHATRARRIHHAVCPA